MAKSPPEKLAQALRANLKRRKAAPSVPPPAAVGPASPQALPQQPKKPG